MHASDPAVKTHAAAASCMLSVHLKKASLYLLVCLGTEARHTCSVTHWKRHSISYLPLLKQNRIYLKKEINPLTPLPCLYFAVMYICCGVAALRKSYRPLLVNTNPRPSNTMCFGNTCSPGLLWTSHQHSPSVKQRCLDLPVFCWSLLTCHRASA